MNKLIEQAISKAGYRSNDALAAAMLRHKPELASSLKARSLGARIGKLAKGEIDWWRKNPLFLDVLTELLRSDPVDIGIHEETADYFFSFAEFPELPPLDLRYEEPCDLAFGANDINHEYERMGVVVREHPLDLQPWLVDGPMLDRRNMPRDLSWLCVPNELGADLLIKQLKVKSAFEVLEVDSLQDVKIVAHAARPLVISVSSQPERDDLVVFAGNPNLASLVISPFPLPQEGRVGGLGGPTDWEVGNLPKMEQDLSRLGSLYTWTLREDWRTRLIAWVQQRLDSKKVDTLFEASEVTSWLDVFDPEERLVRTPADLLTICRMFHGRSKRSRPDAASRNAGSRLQSCLVSIDSKTADTFNRLTDAVWRDLDLSWGEPLDWAQWRKLSAFDGDAELVDGVSRGPSELKTVRSRKVSQQRSGKVSTSLEDLKRNGLLVSVPRRASGDYALKPQLLADLRVRDLLVTGIQKADVQAWGRMALDQGRQHLIDAALSAATINDLLHTVRRLLAADPWDAAVLGASESLFLELGNRRAEGQNLPPEMQGVLEMVLSRYFESGNSGIELLLSRRAVCRVDHPDVLRTISACMGWSLTNRPKIFRKLSAQVLQLFPGWSGKQAVLPLIPDHPGKSSWSSEASPPRWRRFLKAMHKSLLEIASWPLGLDGEQSGALPPLLLVTGLLRGEKVQSDWWEQVVKHRWASDFVIEQLESRKSNNLASRVLGAIVECVYENLSKDKRSYLHIILFGSALWRWAIEHATPSQFMDQVSSEQIVVLREFPQVLPMSWRQHLLEALPMSARGENNKLIGTAGADAKTLLLRRLGTPEGAPAATRLWQLSPGYLLSALDSGQLDESSMIDVLWCSPSHLAAEVVRYIDTLSAFNDRSLRRTWALKRLQANVVHAEQLLSLLK